MKIRIALLTVLAAASLACGGLALAGGPGAPSPVLGGTIQVTRGDDAGTVNAHVGDELEISLGTDYDWRLDAPDGTVIAAPVQNKMLIRGTQAIWLASSVGTATITAWGTIPCPSGDACAMIAVPFSATVVVSR